MRRIYWAILFFIFFLDNPTAQNVPANLFQKKWDAFWIYPAAYSAYEYGVYHFRKNFTLSAKPATFIINVSADNRYKLYVNGKFVSLGPARGDLFHWNFETVDIAQYLQPGKNVLAALVWNFGDQRPEAQISFRTAFILQGNGEPEKMVNTDKSWKCIRDNAYSPLKPDLVDAYYVAGPGDKINYREYANTWDSTGYDDSKWEMATELFNGIPKGVFDHSVGWMLVPRPIPQVEFSLQRLNKVRSTTGSVKLPEGFPAKAIPFTVPAQTKISILMDQGFLTNAYAVLQFSGGSACTVSLSYAEALYIDEGNSKNWKEQNKKGNRDEIDGKRFVGVRDEFIADGKKDQSFTSLSWRTYRYLKLEIQTADEPLIVQDLYGLFTGYPFEMKARFETDSPELKKIFEVGWRTARLCAAETYMDCPYYEQLQYVGDTRIQALVSLFNSGDDRLMRNAIVQLDNSRIAEGITMSRYPTAHHQEIPPFSLWWIGMLHDYWMYRNDKEFVRQHLPGVRQVLTFFKNFQQRDGSLRNLPYWNFTDWAEGKGWHDGVPPIGNEGNSASLDLQLLWAYQLAAELEDSLGIKSLSDMYKRSATQLSGTIKLKYWNKIKLLFSDTPEQQSYSQHPNTLAILTGLVKGEEAKQLMEKILADTSLTQATIYFKYYVHQAVAKVGFGDRYLDLLKDWKNGIANGLTTWAEISDVNEARSDCHAWGSSPNIEFFRIVLGIDAAAPGFQKLRIEPHLGKLVGASGAIPHPAGEVAVNYKARQGGHWSAEISLPPGISGTFIWKGKNFELRPGNKTILNL